ncbi:MAG: dicarboxylate/amino acid:cation symporter [Pseudomonadota bacterium]
MKLWHKVALGLIFGIIYGSINGENSVYIKPVGDLFLNAINMIIVPLIFFSLIAGITSVSDPSSLGRIGIKSCAAYIVTTTFAIITGLCLAILLKPGVGSSLDLSSLSSSSVNTSMVTDFSFVKMFTNIVPNNALRAMTEGNMLQVVFFSIFTGVTILKIESSLKKRLIDIFQMLSQLIFRMVSIIIQFSPYGAFALTGWIVGTQGAGVLTDLLKLIATVISGMTLQYAFFGLFIYIFTKMSPLPFYKKSLEYQALAFSTSSSKATLATTMKVCREKLGISNTSTSFVLPLGAAMNMDGMAIYLGMCTVFFAQVSGVDLAFHDYIIIIITATVGSIGGAGVPGSSMIMLPMILTSVNIPIEGVALIAGIDRILDMIRTTINITGDATVTLIIDKTEGNLSEETYYS